MTFKPVSESFSNNLMNNITKADRSKVLRSAGAKDESYVRFIKFGRERTRQVEVFDNAVTSSAIQFQAAW